LPQEFIFIYYFQRRISIKNELIKLALEHLEKGNSLEVHFLSDALDKGYNIKEIQDIIGQICEMLEKKYINRKRSL
jgi:hypothetical protein